VRDRHFGARVSPEMFPGVLVAAHEFLRRVGMNGMVPIPVGVILTGAAFQAQGRMTSLAQPNPSLARPQGNDASKNRPIILNSIATQISRA
jgi:hypothetical protein